ncbi:MAG: phosphate ABC transporter substrate-binding protein [Piscirickettsiaceae bacterium]|nr:MAG: phosphate ABC transporter substrate-binding protein [Piscirickettsiaceae bacterium]
MKILKYTGSCFLLVFFATSASAHTYQAPVTDSQWQFTGNRVACHLSHTVPQYGVGVFDQRSGEAIKFTLRAEAYVPPIQTAMLTSVPPRWMHDAPILKLASLKGNKKVLSVNSDASERMLQELSNGKFPQFSYKAKQGKVKVSISSINFLAAMSEFEACRQNLLPYSRDDVHQQLALFTQSSALITHQNRKLLKKAGTYIKEAGVGQRIDLVSGTEGFSVKDGRRVYDKRIQSIREHLQQVGISEDRVIALADPEALETPEGSIRLKVAGPEPFRQIYFNSGSVKLNARDHAKLDFMLEYMRLQNAKAKLVLKGHTDSKGSRFANVKVAEKRVAVIKKYLLSKGMKTNQIVTKAYGESKPTTTNRYPGGRQLNRRVEISIVG